MSHEIAFQMKPSKNSDGALDEFNVQVFPHGIIVRTEGISVQTWEVLTHMAKAFDPTWDQLHAGLCSAFSAVAVIGSKESLRAWCEEHDSKCQSDCDPIVGWLMSSRTGLSSRYLLHLIANTMPPERGAKFPRDVEGFELCYDMLHWTKCRDKLHLAVEKDARWKGYVDRWDELSSDLVSARVNSNPDLLQAQMSLLDKKIAQIFHDNVLKKEEEILFAESKSGGTASIEKGQLFQLLEGQLGRPLTDEEKNEFILEMQKQKLRGASPDETSETKTPDEGSGS